MYSNRTMKSALESMMFMWGEPLEVKDAAQVLEADKNDVRALLLELQAEYENEGRGIRIRQVEDSFGFVTHIENEIFISKLCTPVRVKRLSQAALEVLAIIAYRQPVTRGEIDSIRGIKSERVIDGLVDKNLVEVVGRSEGVGRPLVYGTTKEFLKKFGFTSLKDLPEITEFEDMKKNSDDVEMHEQIALNFEADEEEGGNEN
ncbi:MAG: SMC-Scp complex subunit ScpB [Firmicutes bacterium]|nr:SMC-Scp complex subunit ScpB [Bacillota bacterium]